MKIDRNKYIMEICAAVTASASVRIDGVDVVRRGGANDSGFFWREGPHDYRMCERPDSMVAYSKTPANCDAWED